MLKNTLLWIAAFLLSAVSCATALGAISKDKVPELALSLFPTNGFAAENSASQSVKTIIAENQGQYPSRNEVDPDEVELAKQAFIAEPITPQAIAVVAFGGTQNQKSKLMQAAISLSRREQLVTGWMIVDSVSRAEIRGTLQHYDILLRTSSSAASVVIPVMANALANDDFINPFADLLATEPPWVSRFWANVVTTPNSLENAAQLREALHKLDLRDNVYRDPALILALVKNKQFEQAQNLFFLLNDRKKDEVLIENGSFEKRLKFPPFDWQLSSTGEYGAAVTDGKLQLSAVRGSGGLFARQLVKLPKSATMGVIADKAIPDDANIFITLTCAQTLRSAPEGIRVPLKGKIANLQIDNAQTGCRYYWFDITGQASENGNGFDIALDSISLQ